MSNFLLMTDSYKAGHARLYPPDLEYAYAYFESRGGRYDETVFFGLQYYLMCYLQGEVFTPTDIDQAERFWNQHFGRNDYFDADRWRRLYEVHGGRLPLRIKAVEEGTIVPTGNVLFTVENTDPEFAWLVGHVETLLMKVWYPITVATQSFDLKRQLASLRDAYSDNRDGLDFMVHDFGYRGCTSEEQAGIGGAAHLLSFKGTDTVAGIQFLQQWYTDPLSDDPYPMYGYSVPATEHSIILAWGEDGEQECFEHMLESFPEGIIACVSDTYDINKAAHMWVESLKDKVLDRSGTLVIRPDSGWAEANVLNILDWVYDNVGGTENTKGRVVLDSHYRVIQGDGMDYVSIPELYRFIISKGYAPENLTVGAGGGMLQKVDRDTQRFAYKVSEVTRDGVAIPVAKHPVGDKSKASKAGRLVLVDDGIGNLETHKAYGYNGLHDQLRPVFHNGRVFPTHTADDIRRRLDRSL